MIKYAKEKTPLNPVHMSVKEWYRLLVEKNVTKREVVEEGRTEFIPRSRGTPGCAGRRATDYAGCLD